MAIAQKFIYTWPEGKSPIWIEQWIRTLSQIEQDEFRLADKRQKEFRKIVVDQGNLQVVNNIYVWKDKDALDTNKPTDPVWQVYWNRWMTETGAKFTIEQSEI